MTYRELYFKYRNEAIKEGKEDTAIKLLIQELSNFSNTDFYANYDNVVNEEVLNKILDAINNYLNKDIPIQYILGYTYFYGYKLIVNKNVLIPRRETEELVDWVIHNNPFASPKILDIGTGSGAIAITLKANIEGSSVSAVDISEAAIEVAKINASINDQEIYFIKSDIFSNLKNQKFNIIVSNPPYIPKTEVLGNLVYGNEPHIALFAEEDGLFFYKRILEQSHLYLEDKSLIVFEIPEDKDEELSIFVKKSYPNDSYEIKKDLQGKSRILIIKKNWR